MRNRNSIILRWTKRCEARLFKRKAQNQWLTSDFVCPHAFQIFKIFVLLSSDCSTRRHRSVITYWFSAVVPLTEAGSPLIPSLRSNASTNCAHVVSFVIPEIQRCSPCNQIGISSSESIDSDISLISSVDWDDTENDAIDPSEELDEDVDKVHRMGFSVLWLRYWERLFACSVLLLAGVNMEGKEMK